MQNLWAFCMLTVAFLNASSPALIDAIPLSVLPKLRNFLWLGSTGIWNYLGTVGLFALIDAKAHCGLLKHSASIGTVLDLP